ncbi:beta-ketoacyl-[acyl-carrier-protein] synthase family protein [Streptomyces abikoensis]|uniref:beta-ketoacyl-[acyl-carrier-protein] synthase family protein n=1 Tax=Streptomyces abikoensis TaxID=97398 RepID=UPI0036C8E310
MRRTSDGTDVAVTGLGAVTPAGPTAPETWAGLLSGIPRAVPDPLLAGLAVDFSCPAPFDVSARLGPRLAARLDRYTGMAVSAAREAVADARLDTSQWDSSRVAVVMGTASASTEHHEQVYALMAAGTPEKVSPMALMRSMPNMSAGEIGIDLGARGPNLSVSTACASGATAVGLGRDLVRSGACDIAIVGGSESMRTRSAAVCFHQMRALSTRRSDPGAASRPFDAGRDGFVLGEGAGVLVLERTEHARARGVPPYAYLAGYGASCDAHHMTAPHPGGRGAAEALRRALADAGLAPADIGHVNAHGTSTRANDLAEYRALRAVFGGKTPPVTALKAALGHAAGGAGGIQAVCAAFVLRHQVIPPTPNLVALDPAIDLDVVTAAPRRTAVGAVVSDSFGFGGQNAVLAFRAA